jgi:hypothetical protein
MNRDRFSDAGIAAADPRHLPSSLPAAL